MRLPIDRTGRWHGVPSTSEQGLGDADLVQAAQRGDRLAFAQLYENNVASVYRYLRSRAEPADAEDITADVFIKAMRGLPSYRNRGLPFVAWLLRIARNELADHHKRRKREAHAPLDDASLGRLAAQDDPEHTALHLAEVENVRFAMNQLTDLQQEVLRLRFDAQLSVAETAHAMKRNEGAVKVLQHSALRALRRAMGADAA